MFKRIALTVVSAAAIVGFAAPAQASSSWICNTLGAHPNKQGVITIITTLLGQGYTADNGGPELIVGTVADQCPELLPVLQSAAAQIA